MADDLRVAAERVVNHRLLSIERAEPEHFLVGDFLDAFLASPECLALAVRECTDGNGDFYETFVRDDVAALLDGGQG